MKKNPPVNAPDNPNLKLGGGSEKSATSMSLKYMHIELVYINLHCMWCFFQTPLTAVGSWFALSQSAGVVGTALVTKGALGGGASVITYATLGLLSNCEKE